MGMVVSTFHTQIYFEYVHHSHFINMFITETIVIVPGDSREFHTSDSSSDHFCQCLRALVSGGEIFDEIVGCAFDNPIQRHDGISIKIM